jgi:hypothetical protein
MICFQDRAKSSRILMHYFYTPKFYKKSQSVNQINACSVKVTTHQESGLTHRQPAHPSEVVKAKAGCGLTGNQAGQSPLDEGFFHGWIYSYLPHPDIRQSG